MQLYQLTMITLWHRRKWLFCLPSLRPYWLHLGIQFSADYFYIIYSNIDVIMFYFSSITEIFITIWKGDIIMMMSREKYVKRKLYAKEMVTEIVQRKFHLAWYIKNLSELISHWSIKCMTLNAHLWFLCNFSLYSFLENFGQLSENFSKQVCPDHSIFLQNPYLLIVNQYL